MSTTTTLKRTGISVDEFVNKQAADHGRRLGGAKGRARQAATRRVARAKAERAEALKEQACRAVSQIVREIEEIEGRIGRARPAARNPRGGKWAQRANHEITWCLARLKDLRAEHAHFAAQM